MDSNQVKTAAVITKEKSYLPSFVEEPAQQGMLLDAWYKKSVWYGCCLLSHYYFPFLLD